MNYSGKEILTKESVENIKKAFKKICKEQYISMSEVFHKGEDRRFNVFDFANEYGYSVSYEQAYNYISKWIA